MAGAYALREERRAERHRCGSGGLGGDLCVSRRTAHAELAQSCPAARRVLFVDAAAERGRAAADGWRLEPLLPIRLLGSRAVQPPPAPAAGWQLANRSTAPPAGWQLL